MKDKILNILKNETGSYLFYGVLTTVINYLSFSLALTFLGYDRILIVNTISFICAVVFAYVTNKLFVFKSKSWKWSTLKVEIPSFLSARILSYFFEQFGLYLSVDIFHLERYSLLGIDGVFVFMTKIGLSFAVVILNWAVSKFFIFKRDR